MIISTACLLVATSCGFVCDRIFASSTPNANATATAVFSLDIVCVFGRFTLFSPPALGIINSNSYQTTGLSGLSPFHIFSSVASAIISLSFLTWSITGLFTASISTIGVYILSCPYFVVNNPFSWILSVHELACQNTPIALSYHTLANRCPNVSFMANTASLEYRNFL